MLYEALLARESIVEDVERGRHRYRVRYGLALDGIQGDGQRVRAFSQTFGVDLVADEDVVEAQAFGIAEGLLVCAIDRCIKCHIASV